MSFLYVSCTTYKKDDHSYTYFYQYNNNSKTSEEQPPTQTLNKNSSDKFFNRTKKEDLDRSESNRFESDLYYYQKDSEFLSRNTPYYKGNGVSVNPRAKRFMEYGEDRW
jgi:hypothetical protein